MLETRQVFRPPAWACLGYCIRERETGYPVNASVVHSSTERLIIGAFETGLVAGLFKTVSRRRRLDWHRLVRTSSSSSERESFVSWLSALRLAMILAGHRVR